MPQTVRPEVAGQPRQDRAFVVAGTDVRHLGAASLVQRAEADPAIAGSFFLVSAACRASPTSCSSTHGGRRGARDT
ncbi:hypothetical protein GCM10017786_53570 [Amycolatopsis deserti]|uniref:Uncharacterized protein n=1 Tax=Amycolatopsis deserti TaxID=185696 RepID=A0ABQ3JDE1_9PSEU|nr:hypothetical protein GCM10017786_53570 [Amycolatopsis deserti]